MNQYNINNEENVDFELEINIEEEGPPEKKGKGVAPKMSFKHGWKLIHKWTYPIIGPNEEERIKCAWCVKFKGDTPYAMEGNSTNQLNGQNRHTITEARKHSI